MVRSINLITATTAIATVLATVGIVQAEKGNSDGDGDAKQSIELPAIIAPHTSCTMNRLKTCHPRCDERGRPDDPSRRGRSENARFLSTLCAL